VLGRLLAGPGFLGAGACPEISFRSELLAWVPTGWRAAGHRPPGATGIPVWREAGRLGAGVMHVAPAGPV
jgi:hypothetical protein